VRTRETRESQGDKSRDGRDESENEDETRARGARSRLEEDDGRYHEDAGRYEYDSVSNDGGGRTGQDGARVW
jgi:hypothetical protein